MNESGNGGKLDDTDKILREKDEEVKHKEIFYKVPNQNGIYQFLRPMFPSSS